MAENLVLVDETISSTLIFVGAQTQPVVATGDEVELVKRLALLGVGIVELPGQSQPWMLGEDRKLLNTHDFKVVKKLTRRQHDQRKFSCFQRCRRL